MTLDQSPPLPVPQPARNSASALSAGRREILRIADLLGVVEDLAIARPACFLIERIVVFKALSAIARQRPQIQIVGGLGVERQGPAQRDVDHDTLVEAAFAE